ncbi:MAG: beta-propeller domain-containing protein [Clostridia bacterium]|nr:beta-propeller domain-containing protein [Clostridia bacterium]
MKREKLLRALDGIDEKYILQADPTPRKKNHTPLKILVACLCGLFLLTNLWLFLPYGTTPPSVAQYKNSEYFDLIVKLNDLLYDPPRYKNNFDYLTHAVLAAGKDYAPMTPDGSPNYDLDLDFSGSIEDSMNSDNVPEQEEDEGKYEEVTDNQTEGVIEADRIKRSDKYIFYLYGTDLSVYSIQGMDSKLVGTYDAGYNNYMKYTDAADWEFYLSQDCKTVTIIAPYTSKENKQYVELLALDVSDPTQIKQKAQVTITGDYTSSRLTDGTLLLMTEFAVYRNTVDFGDERTFLPQINYGSGFECLKPNQIISPENLTKSRYTVILKLNENDLSAQGTAAFLSFSQNVYVSQNNIFATNSYRESRTEDGYEISETVTEIACIGYRGDNLTIGDVTAKVRGEVKDQYSMDEKDGVLRVVTTTSTLRSALKGTSGKDSAHFDEVVPSWFSETNASLFCIDLSSMQIIGELTSFAPKGESVQSVRFDGNMAYVCTSIKFTDPVFFIDLSDPKNIKVKDTGVIEGYSSSLINLGDGFLLGIGLNDSNTVKVEVYEETATGVRSVDQYLLHNGRYSTDYKSYYINRDLDMIGFCFYDYNKGPVYILLQFNGYKLNTVLTAPVGGEIDWTRGVLIDDYFYLLSKEFSVHSLTDSAK